MMIEVICPICISDNVEKFKMKESANKKARVSYVGYHCHNCNRVRVFEVNTFRDDGVSKAFSSAYERFRNIE